MAVDAQDFKAALGRFCSGVTVVTMNGPEGDHWMTASAFSSLSLDPPLILVCVKKGNHTHDLMDSGSGFAVNILDKEQVSVSNRFGGWWEEGKSKWADLEVTRAPVSGAAFIGGALAWLDCSKHAALDGGDHTILVGEVQGATSFGERDSLEPLLYFAGKYRSTGEAI